MKPIPRAGQHWLLTLCAVAALIPAFDVVAAPKVPPTITSQPQSLTVITGGAASFSVTATGTAPLNYQWRKNGTPISGATAETYGLATVTTNDAAGYDVVVQNAYGTATSSTATLTVYVPPWFAVQPTNLVVTNGNNAAFTAGAQGIPAPALQWFFGASPLPGQVSSTLSLLNVQASQAGSYYCVASNAVGTATSAVATLAVMSPPAITAQPQSRAVLAGTTTTFTATVNGTGPLNYQWQRNGVSLVNDGRISGAGSSGLAITDVQPADAGSYTLRVVNNLGAVTSAVATLTVVLPGDCAAAADGLVGWWPGDGNGNDVVGTNNATLQGGATASGSGWVGSAFGFDGTNNYVAIADAPALKPTNLTVEAWVNFSDLESSRLGVPPSVPAPGSQYIVFKQNSRAYQFEGYVLEKHRTANGDVFMFTAGSASGEEVLLLSSTPISTSVWYHVAAVRGSNFMQLYVNGQLENQTNVNFPQDYGTLPLYFGSSQQTYWDAKLKGSLDEVSLYNRALSSGEIAAIYAVGAAGKCKGAIITVQPQNQGVVAGGNAVFTVGAKGYGTLSYQWRYNGGSLGGATGTSLVLSNVQPSHAGSYSVVVTNSLGSATSAVATLTVWVPPMITVQPQSTTNVVGTTASFSVTATGTGPLSYQWQFNGGVIAGATGSSLVRSGVMFGDAGSYRVVVTNVAGAVTSGVAVLTVVCPAVSVSPGSLPDGVVGGAYSQTLTASGGMGPYAFTVNEGTLPAGLSLTSVGVLSGVPSLVGTNSFTVRATDTNGCWGTQGYSLAITGVPPAITVQPQSTTNVVGTTASFSVTATGTGPLSYQWQFNGGGIAGATGSSLVRGGVMFGDAGSYRVVVTNVAGAVTSGVAVLTVVCPAVSVSPGSLPDGVVGGAYSQTLTASGGMGPYAFSVSGGVLPGGLSLTSGGLLSGVPSGVGTNSFTVKATDTNGCWGTQGYSLVITGVPPVITTQPQSTTNVVGTTASFSVTATGTGPLSYQWQFNGGVVAGATGSSLVRSGVMFGDAGSYRVVVTNVAGAVTSGVAVLTVVCPAVSVSPGSLPGGLVGSGYSQTLTASGGMGPYAFSVSGGVLPGGLSLTSGGLLSGVPTGVGTNSFAVKATDTNGCWGSQGYSLAVAGTQPVITVQPQSTTNVVGTTASFSVTATGTGPLSYQWQFNGGVIAGATGSSLVRSGVMFGDAGSYRVVVTNVAGSVTSGVAVLTVVCPAVSVSPGSLPGGLVGSGYSQTLTASGGMGPYAFSVSGGVLPGGLSLTSGGVLSGVPSGVGTNSFTVRAMDTNGCSGSQGYSLAVAGTQPAITVPPASLIVAAGTNATFSVAASGTAPLGYQWRFNGGVIAGATSTSLFLTNVQPANAGGYTVVVTNTAGSATSVVATLTVVVPAACVPAADGMVGWWPGEGNANDIGGTNNGTLLGGATASAAGIVGSALSFDGTNSYVQIPDSPVLRPTNLTIEAWVRFNSLDSPASGSSPAGQQYLVFRENTHLYYFAGFALTKTRVAGQDVFDFKVESADGQSVEVASQTPVVTGAWYHVAGVRGAGFIQLYVNGQLEGQTNVSFPQDYGDYPLCLGTTAQATWDHKLAGALDEVSLFNRALSAGEIAAIHAAGADGKCKGVFITSQPQGGTVTVGANVTLTVAASGSFPRSCQWQRDGVNVTDGGHISGASSAVLSLANVSLDDSGSYRVIITNVINAVTSAVAVLQVVPPSPPSAQNAGAVVLVNSQSAKYLDFQHFIQPYLNNFGFPYTVQDVSTNAPGPGLTNCAVIIIGHSQLDTNHTYLDATAQTSLSLAVSNGTGLVNFDNDLSAGGVGRYGFVQEIFGFSYETNVFGTNVSLPPTEPSSQMHYITARHPASDTVAFRSDLTLPGIMTPAEVKVLVWSGGRPLVAISKYGQGRAVQWGSYGWMVSTVLGPVDGLDDVVWRGVVWAARKPFVMRGLPHFVTMRVDDVSGPLDWVHAANAVGFKPFVALFMSNVVETSAADLRTLTTSGKATAGIHSFDCCHKFFYFDHAAKTANSDLVQSNNFYLGTQWHTNHGIPISKVCATHYSEIGPNCFAGLKAWGVEYVPIEVVPGTVEYAAPGAAWMVARPYRLYDTPQPGQVPWPTYYADWLTVPGHPEFDGQFFNVYSELRDVTSCGEWCPDNDVAASIGRATRIAKRALDSMVMATIFGHEYDIYPVYAGNWQAIVQGITNELASYDPLYVTLDHASQYVRAMRTSRLVSSAYDPDSGQVTASFTGKTDLDTQVLVFQGEDSSITNEVGFVPVFSESATNPVVLFGPPVVLNPPSSQTSYEGTTAAFSVVARGAWPMIYQWYQNGTNALRDNGAVSGAGSATLRISKVLYGDAGSYSVVITNAEGGVTSPAAVLTVVNYPVRLSAPTTANGTFSFTLSGKPGQAYELQVSTNLHQWALLAWLTNLTGQVDFTDPTASNSPSRFYRARVP